jgi:hypothetical protein
VLARACEQGQRDYHTVFHPHLLLARATQSWPGGANATIGLASH